MYYLNINIDGRNGHMYIAYKFVFICVPITHRGDEAIKQSKKKMKNLEKSEKKRRTPAK